MKLGIITDCVHFYNSNGEVSTENHIFLRQMEALASYFTETLVCCPFSTFDLDKVYSTYDKKNIKFIPLPDVGGNTIAEKLKLFTAIPAWLAAFKKINKASDVVYQRFPNNLNIPGFFYFFLKKKPVFATYTGTWDGYLKEPKTYRLQRWLLQKYFRGPVWVYKSETTDPRIKPGFSPSYNIKEWKEEWDQVAARIDRLKNGGLPVLRLITVGALVDYKNQIAIVKACAILKSRQVPFKLTIVGDGPMRQALADCIAKNNLKEQVILAGKKNHVALRELYRQHDFVVQAPLSEGFGKVPVEGFFHGVIPVINNIAMAKYMTGNKERGFLFNAADTLELADTLTLLRDQPETLITMIKNGREFARSQTLESWAEDYFLTITDYFERA